MSFILSWCSHHYCQCNDGELSIKALTHRPFRPRHQTKSHLPVHTEIVFTDYSVVTIIRILPNYSAGKCSCFAFTELCHSSTTVHSNCLLAACSVILNQFGDC